MKCSNPLKTTAVVLLLLAGPVLAAEQDAAKRSPHDTDWKKGKLGDLAKYVGTYRYEPILDDPRVAAALSELLGDEVSHLIDNLQVRGPVNMYGPGLVLVGQKPHEGDRERATVVVDMYNGRVHALIFSEGTVTVYSMEKSYAFLPHAIRESARWDEIWPLLEAPPRDGFTWIGKGKWE